MAPHVPLRKRFLQLFKAWLPGAFRHSMLVVDGSRVSASEALSLATYNLQNYRLSPHEGFSAKSLKSCLAAQELAIEYNADAFLIQEIGSEKALNYF